MQVFVLIARSSAARAAGSIAAYEPAKSGSEEVLMSAVFNSISTLQLVQTARRRRNYKFQAESYL
jgi:hypothetical protein